MSCPKLVIGHPELAEKTGFPIKDFGNDGQINRVYTQTLNRWGRVIKKKRGRFSEGFSSIWIPVNKMEIGDNFDNGYTVVRRDRWRQWEVLVVKDSLFGGERYFDINTGFWVGLSVTTGMGAATFVLVDTNADIPVKE